MERYNPSIDVGLNDEQVNIRNEQRLNNKETTVPTKSIKRIIFDNLFTLFNILNFILALLVLSVNSYKNLLFMGIVICNTLISTFQEIRSKLIIDKLSINIANKVKVIRNKKVVEIDIDDIVLDDIIMFKTGNQIVTDSIILEGEVQVNESFITGETELISYKKGDLLKSGSFIVVGSCKAKVEHVGLDNYTQVISKDAKYVKPINSILMNSLNKIVKLISIVIIPLGIILFINQYGLDKNLSNAIVNTVAAIISMIPEGLVLLTSTVLAVSVIRLAKLNVLVQELYCIEMLARVDVICLDKTGTITDGNMEVIKVINLDNYDIDEIMGNIVSNLDDDNATFRALKKHFKLKDNYNVIKKISFSPITKYSGVEFDNGTFIVGAPEFICDKKIKEVIDNQDNRVLLICKKGKVNKPIGVIVLKDTIRKNAKKTLEYFKSHGVDIKIISGDNIKTVSKIAKEAGLTDIRCVDVSGVDDLEGLVLNNNIFARVTPIQKKKIVEILQKNNRFVAMTGDGVNDVLALKQADCSITIKNATDAARNVSQLVLLDDDFDSIPNIVKEGRRTINNIERSATLFLAKTSYAFLLVLSFIFINFRYPFEPIQLSLTNVFTIGIPSFILALEPNNERITGNFLIKVFSRAFPTALTMVINIISICVLGKLLNLEQSEISTLCVIMNAFIGFLLLFKICYPLNKLRLSLIIILLIGFIISILGLKSLFSLTLLNLRMFMFIIILVILSTVIFSVMSNLVDKLINKYPKLFS